MYFFKHFQHFIPEFRGYRAQSTADINDGDSLLEIGGGGGDQEINLLKCDDFFPQKLVLRALFQPTLKPSSQTQVTLITQGEPLKTGHLYNDLHTHIESDNPPQYAQYQNVKLVYQGVGIYQINQESFALQGQGREGFQIIFPEDNVVYKKPFAYEQRASVTERVTKIDDGRIFVNPPRKFDVKVLRPYGGYYRPGISAEQCKQVYYDLSETGESTSVLLTLGKNWQEDQIFPEILGDEMTGSTFFSPSLHPEQALSLGGALCSGYGKIYLQVEDQKRLYQSMSYLHPGNNTQLIDVTFIPAQ